MESPRPPSNFVLRPHHVALCALFVFAYKDVDSKRYTPAFQLYLHRLLLDEVSEVTKPKPAAALQKLLAAAPDSEELEARKLIASFRAFVGYISYASSIAHH